MGNTDKTTLRVIRRLEGGGLAHFRVEIYSIYQVFYFHHIHRFLSAHVPAPRGQQALLFHPGSTNQSVRLFIYVSTVLRSINLSVYLLLFIDLSIYPSLRSVYLFSCFSIYLLIYLFICVTLCLSICLYIRNFLSIYQSVYLSIYLFYLVFF